MHTGTFWRPGRLTLLAAALVAVGLLWACQRAPAPPGNATPEQAVISNLRLAAMGDFDGLMQNRLPPAAYATWRTEWEQARARPAPVSAAQDRQFAAIMQTLTAADAEAQLAARLEPALAGLQAGTSHPLPVWASILEAAGRELIISSPQLGGAQQGLANGGLDAVVAWTASTDFSSARKGRQAIATVCATARQLHVQNLAQWRALGYTEAMRDYGLIWNALVDVLKIYGLNLGKALTSAKVTGVAGGSDRVTVQVEMQLAGRSLTAQWPMQRVKGHWYDAALLDAWRQAHPAPAATITAAPIPAGSTGLAVAASASPAPASSR